MRVRAKLERHSTRPRLVVTRTNQHIYAQVLGLDGKIVAASSDISLTKTKDKATKTEKASLVGAQLAQKAIKAKIKYITFDRGYYKYHGRVKALAEAARQAGLEF